MTDRSRADDLILVSVDDHICEPADMFDAHVPDALPRPRAARRRRGRAARSSGTTATSGAGTSGSTRSRASRPSSSTSTRCATSTCGPVATTCTSGCATCRPAVSSPGSNFPNWTGFSGQVLEPGPGPRRQPRDDQGVQRLARRRVVRRVSRTVHPVRHPPAVRRRTKPRREVHRLAAKGCHAVTFSENPAGLGMPSIHTDAWDPLFAACCRDRDRAVLSRRVVVEERVDVARRARARCR